MNYLELYRMNTIYASAIDQIETDSWQGIDDVINQLIKTRKKKLHWFCDLPNLPVKPYMAYCYVCYMAWVDW